MTKTKRKKAVEIPHTPLRTAQFVVLFIIFYIIYTRIDKVDLSDPCTTREDRSCNEKKRKITLKNLLIIFSKAIILVCVVWTLLRFMKINTTVLFSSLGISLAVIGLSIQTILEEYMYGITYMSQNRPEMWDTIHVYSKWGKWIPDIHKPGMKVVGINPMFFTFQFEDGKIMTLNCAQVSGFAKAKYQEASERNKDVDNDDNGVDKDVDKDARNVEGEYMTILPNSLENLQFSKV